MTAIEALEFLLGEPVTSVSIMECECCVLVNGAEGRSLEIDASSESVMTRLRTIVQLYQHEKFRAAQAPAASRDRTGTQLCVRQPRLHDESPAKARRVSPDRLVGRLDGIGVQHVGDRKDVGVMRPISGCVCARCAAVSRGEDDPGHFGRGVKAGGLGDVWLAFCHLAAAVAFDSGIRTRLNAALADLHELRQRDALLLFFVNGHELPARPGRMKEYLPS